jgi:hypothetical protein
MKTYYEDSFGFWCKREYDSNGNSAGDWYKSTLKISENSDGVWCKYEYDSKGNQNLKIHLEEGIVKVVEIEGKKYKLTSL